MKTNEYEEPRVMRELHAIREKHYEETKHMTDEEYIKWVNEKARKVMREYGMESKYENPN
jgi:hypothetical protein